MRLMCSVRMLHNTTIKSPNSSTSITTVSDSTIPIPNSVPLHSLRCVSLHITDSSTWTHASSQRDTVFLRTITEAPVHERTASHVAPNCEPYNVCKSVTVRIPHRLYLGAIKHRIRLPILRLLKLSLSCTVSLHLHVVGMVCRCLYHVIGLHEINARTQDSVTMFTALQIGTGRVERLPGANDVELVA